MSRVCEQNELRISVWLDEGLGRGEQTELLDHLVRCGSCRRFYAEARALEGLAAVAGPGPTAEAPPREVWARIEAVAGERAKGKARVLRFPSAPPWILRAAAALLLAAGLIFALWPSPPRQERVAEDRIDVRLEENRGAMSDSRFAELAAEVLRADRKYHRAMHEVMEQVIRDSWSREGEEEEAVRQSEGDEEGESSSRLRA